VERDKSMEAMIDSGEEWMEPLLEVRNWLALTGEPSTKHRYREVRRRNGNVQIWGEEENKKIVWGPYKLDIRREILRRVLAAQTLVRKTGPDPTVALITEGELQEIRRIWRTEEGDWQDSLPAIYRDETGADLDWVMDDTITSTALDASVLSEVCAEAGLPVGMLRELIDYERELQGLGRRQGVYEKIDGILSKDWRTAEQVFTEIKYNPDNELDEGAEADDAP
jgi:DNA sulfur modification protein DndC